MTEPGGGTGSEAPRASPSPEHPAGGGVGQRSAPPLPPPPPPPAYGVPLEPGWLPAFAVRRVQAPPPPTEATLAIPLDTAGLVGQSLDLLTRSDSGLRLPSFYIGFVLMVTLAPLVALSLLAFLVPGEQPPGPANGNGAGSGTGGENLAWLGWLMLAGIPGMLGYVVATIEARALATAVIGARAEGRPLRLVESISLVRKRFWRVLGAQLLIGFVIGLTTTVASVAVLAVVGPVEPISYGVQLLLGLLLGAPVVYVPAAIMLGGTGVLESIRRSFGLARSRKGLAVVVTLFGLVSQLIVLFGLSAGLDAIARFIVGTGLTEAFPPPLVVPMTAAFVFAIGTLVFLVEVIAAAPPVFAFIALTHYTWGLEAGRQDPVRIRHLWDPWLTPGLALAAALALLALVGGVVSLPA